MATSAPRSTPARPACSPTARSPATSTAMASPTSPPPTPARTTSPSSSARRIEASYAGGIVHVIVTGAAGFIGSHTCGRLVAAGHRVTGIDSFDGYLYPAEIKQL